MAGERKKLTAAEKGKAVMVEKKKRDKDIEAAINAAHAAELRPRGVVIREEQVDAVESPVLRRSVRNRTASTGMDPRGIPGSRKRTRDDDIMHGRRATSDRVPSTPPPPPPLIVDGDDYLGLFLKASRSVVTVGFEKPKGSSTVTQYQTGFILIDEENYSLVLTTWKAHKKWVPNRYFVYFGGENSKTEAYKFISIQENDLLILIVPTDERHEAVNFSSHPLSYEVVFTVCAMSNIKLNDKANAPLVKELEGRLGFYKGIVGTPACDALNASYEHIVGSEKYFQVGFALHDDIITLENIDEEKHAAEIAMSAPVFRLNGETAGMIFSEGGWIDSKIGMLAKSIILCIQTNLGVDDWKESLKDGAKTWFKETA